MSSELRKSPRIPSILDVLIQGRDGLAKVLDISESGVFIGLPDICDLKTDDKIELFLRLPQEPKPFRIQARVARITPDGIGAEFLSQSYEETDIEYLFNVLRYTLPLAQAPPKDKAPAERAARQPVSRILAAVSFSAASLCAVNAAADLAAATGAALLIFHAVPKEKPGAARKGKDPAALFNEKVRPLLAGVHHYEFFSLPGEPAAAILRAAGDLRADLLVLGRSRREAGREITAKVMGKYRGGVMVAAGPAKAKRC